VSTRVALALVLFIALTAASGGAELDTLLIKSIGGETALARIKNLKSYQISGSIIWNGLNGKYSSFFRAPDKIRITADFGTFSIEQGFDGQNAWQKDLHGRVFDLAGFEKKELMRSVYFMSFAYVIDGRLPGSFELLDTFVTAGSSGFSINFYPFMNDTVAAAFEIGKNLHIIQFARLDNLIVSTELSDFKSIDSILFPFYSLSAAENTPMMTEVTVDSIALDITVDDTEFSKPLGALKDFHFPANAASVNIPFQFSNGHLMVFVEINGLKKGWFILDTGASTTYYDAKFVSELGLNPVGELPLMGLGGFENIRLIRVDSLNLGRLTLYSQIAGVLPLDQLALQIHEKTVFGGLLGYDFFMRFPVLIDFKKQELTIFNSSKFVLPENGITLSFHLTMMIPTITAALNGITGDFLIDLGNSLGLIVHKKFSEQLTGLSAVDTGAVLKKTLAGVGPGVAGREIHVESLQINAHLLKIPEALVAESSEGLTGSWEIAGNIGTKVLEQYRVLFDYPNSRIVLYGLEEANQE